MFSFHKNDALTRSRQSSVDSQATGSYPSSSIYDRGTSPDYALPANAGAYPPEQQPKIFTGRRGSVFNLRSRSNTATSTSPSLLSLSHPDMADHDGSWNEYPFNRLQSGDQSQSDASSTNGSRRSFFRGRKGKRLSEAVISAVGTADQGDAAAEDRRMSVLRKGKWRNDRADDAGSDLIHQISKPFDFQHLSHTDRHQFAALEKVSGDELVAGFRAARVSQAPSQVPNGLRADHLHFRNFSSENLASMEDRAVSASSLRSPPRSPGAFHEWQQPNPVPQAATARPALRLARSVESFSQPGVSPRKHVYPTTVASPSRLTSQLSASHARTESDIGDDEDATVLRRSSRSKRESGVWDSFALSAMVTPDQLPGIQEDSYFGHALTTPGDSAIHATTPPFSPNLADVAEEPERFTSPRPAPNPPTRSPTTPRSPYFESFSFTSQRSSNVRTHGRKQTQTSPLTLDPNGSLTRPTSEISEALASPDLTSRSYVQKPSASHRRSNTWRAIEESWEDDVDYIYENALEADCDLEWDCDFENDVLPRQQRNFDSTREEDQYRRMSRGVQASASHTRGDSATHDAFGSSSFRTSLLVPSSNSLPDLVPTSAVSASTTSTGLPTPCDSLNVNHFDGQEGFILDPSLLIPHDYKDAQEVTYEDILEDYESSDRHFPMLDARQSIASSARSSHVRFSRRSSYDSSFMSSAQNSGLWNSPVRRSASSAGSVPELVPSRRTRKELGFSVTIDQLSDQVAEKRDFDESKDDDLTPPGRTLDGRTFFTSDEDSQETERPLSVLEDELRESLEQARCGPPRTRSSVIENELRASLDLARRGSQRSTLNPTRQHKPTLSDSAAKLLSTSSVATEAMSTKSRPRAATTTLTRQPMLSLFPTPPRVNRQ